MVEPIGEGNMSNSLLNAKKKLRERKITNFLYPEKMVKKFINLKKYPTCIFMPDKKVLRIMIKACVLKPPAESNETFFVRFGLIDDP